MTKGFLGGGVKGQNNLSLQMSLQCHTRKLERGISIVEMPSSTQTLTLCNYEIVFICLFECQKLTVIKITKSPKENVCNKLHQ